MKRRRISNWLSIVNEDADAGPVELLIYDQIGTDWFDNSGVDAKTFAETLQGIARNREITVRLNSPGGNVYDGLAIYNALQTRRDKVTIRVDGVAASIASVIAMAGKETQMPKSALLMVHRASGLGIGNAQVMRKLADELEIHDEVLAGVYADKAGGTVKDWLTAMDAETWYTGEQALKEGLADVVTDDQVLTANFNLSHCRRVPAALKKTNNNPQPPRPADQQRDSMKRNQILALFASLSVPIAADAAEAVLLAELQKLFAAGKVTKDQFKDLSGQEPQATSPSTAPPPSPAAPASPTASAAPSTPAPAVATVDPAEFQRVRQQLQTERNARITSQFDALAAANPMINRDQWLPRVLADETLMDTLRSLPMPAPGAEPIRASITNSGNPLIEAYRSKRKGAERNEFRLHNFEALQRAHREFQPRAVNTFAASLVTDWLADGVITVANNRLSMLSAFSRDMGTDPLKPRAKVQVRKASATSSAQTNPSSWETGDSTLEAIPVTVNNISKSFTVTAQELNQGFRLQHLAGINANTFVNAISDVVTPLLVYPTYGTIVVGAAASFDSADLAPILAAAKDFKERNLVMDGGHLAYLLPANTQAFAPTPGTGGGYSQGAFGFDGIHPQNRWTSAQANAVGLVCGPEAVAVASGLPIEQPAGEFLSLSTETIEPIGLSIQIATWYSRASRSVWGSFDVMFGGAAGDTSQGKVLVVS